MEVSVSDSLFNIAKSLPIGEQTRLFELLKQNINENIKADGNKNKSDGYRVSDFEHQKYLIENIFSNPKS